MGDCPIREWAVAPLWLCHPRCRGSSGLGPSPWRRLLRNSGESVSFKCACPLRNRLAGCDQVGPGPAHARPLAEPMSPFFASWIGSVGAAHKLPDCQPPLRHMRDGSRYRTLKDSGRALRVDTHTGKARLG